MSETLHANSRTVYDYRDLLRYIYDSEECKIDSSDSKKLKELCEELCVVEHKEFFDVYCTVEDDIMRIKQAGRKKTSFQLMYEYSSSEFLDIYKDIDPQAKHKNLVMWQMIIEMLFMGMNPNPTKSQAPQPITRELTVVEENAIFYAGGYVLRKIMSKYRGSNDEKETALVSALTSMIGDTSSLEATSSYLDYVKAWTKQVDRGGLIHMSDDAYRLFCSIENITYGLLNSGTRKENVISSVMGDNTVSFYWYLLVGELKEEWSHQLFSDVVTLWFTLRGFNVASKTLECYKVGLKKNIKGTKAFRKELH